MEQKVNYLFNKTDKLLIRQKNMRVRYLNVIDGERVDIGRFPIFHKTGSIRGIKKHYYGLNALLVRSGSYIYNVNSEPAIYNMAH